jgi:hypothetical protein
MLSFICTLSNALSQPNQCAPINADNAPIRNLNGAGISLFDNEVRINIVDSYIAPSADHPSGGFTVSVINDYCSPIKVIFKTPDGPSYNQVLPHGSSSGRTLVPLRVAHGGILRVTILDHW